MKTRLISSILLLGLILEGCAQNPDLTTRKPDLASSSEPQRFSPENPITKPTQSVVEVLPLSTPLTDLPPQGDSIPMPSDPDIQKLITTAIEDLAKRFSIPSNQIEFKEVTEVVWPDSSLGCSNSASSYLQVLTPGYLIRLQSQKQTFEYHTNKNNLVIYCENPSPLPSDVLQDR